MILLRNRSAAVVLSVFALASPVSGAHVMDTGTVTVNVVDQRVYIAATLPSKAFPSANTEEIGAQVSRSFRISSSGRETSLQGVIVSIDRAGHDDIDAYAVLIIGVAVFDARPERLRVAIEPTMIAKTGALDVIASRNVEGRAREVGRRSLSNRRTVANFSIAAH